MNALAKVFALKITATVLVWCVPLILLPEAVLEALGFPRQESYLFVRLLGWAYLALCVGYGSGLRAALAKRRAPGPTWMGIISNAGACVLLAYFGLAGTWYHWGAALQALLWASIAASFLITLALYAYGVHGQRDPGDKGGQ